MQTLFTTVLKGPSPLFLPGRTGKFDLNMHLRLSDYCLILFLLSCSCSVTDELCIFVAYVFVCEQVILRLLQDPKQAKRCPVVGLQPEYFPHSPGFIVLQALSVQQEDVVCSFILSLPPHPLPQKHTRINTKTH